MARQKGVHPVASNRRARHDYFIEETYECGLALHGTEVKSIRQGHVNLKESFAHVKDGEVLVESMHISPYEQGNIFNRDPVRTRRLLMHRKEINKLLGTVTQQGLTLVPLSIYFRGSRVKLEIGLCKGKKLYDKRDAAAAKQADRDIERAMKSRYD